MNSKILGTTKSQGQKEELDKFYTNPVIALRCIKMIEDITSYDDVIEPSAGSGSFANQIEKCKAYDIKPEGSGIEEADWFTLDKEQFSSNSLVIGNPPFGIQSKLAVNFFNEAAKFAKTIAFILPLSFKKDSVMNRLDLDFHLKKEVILPKNSFLLNGEDYNVPSVFQIWERGSVKRAKIKYPMKSRYFAFVNRDNCDFRVPRVGGNTGVATFSLEGATASNYFIKNTSCLSNDDLVNLINRTVFPSIEYTVGPKSLSRGEMVYTLDKEIKKEIAYIEDNIDPMGDQEDSEEAYPEDSVNLEEEEFED